MSSSSMKAEQQPQKKKVAPPPTPFYFGGVASSFAAMCTHPIDTIKVRMQTDKVRRGTIPTTIMVVKNEGIMALYRGLSASILRQMTYSTVRFGAYDALKVVFGETSTKPLSFGGKLVVGMISGGIGGLCGNPADVVNIRMQADGRLPPAERRNYKNAFDGLARIVKDEGVLSLWKGWGPNFNRAMFMTASQVATYDQFKQMLLATGYFKDNITTHFSASLLAGLVATTVCSPFDVIKTRIMNMKGAEYTGTLDCFLKIMKNEGPIALFKGWTPSYSRLGPHTILTFIFLEQMKIMYAKSF